MLHGVGDFGEHPGRDEEEGECLLSLIAQEGPSGERGERPHEHGGRPVLLHVEDLADESDGCAGGDGADGVQRGGEAEEPAANRPAAEVKERYQGADKRQARAGTEFVPMRGDEQDDAAGEEDAAEYKCDQHFPAEAAGGPFRSGAV